MMKTISYTVVLHKRFNNDNFGVYIGEDVPSGIYIVTVEPNSPAANAKIQPGDRVLAVNGQLVSSMSMNPKEMIIQIANNAESLALSIQPSNILQLIGIGSMNDNDQDLPPQNKGIDRDLEKYIMSLFTENVEITPLVSSNRNEYALTSSGYAHRRRRRHRKHRPLKTIETQTSIIDEQKERLSQQRPIPSMGTSHALLRNTQLNPKDNEINNSPEIKPSPNIPSPIKNSDFNTNEKVNYTPEPISPPRKGVIFPPPLSNARNVSQENRQPPVEITNRPSPSTDDGLHEVRLRRSSQFPGFGFHLQYNRIFYIIHHIESNSPAERSGLRADDVIRRVNNQKTDQMPHENFVQLMDASTEVIFLVQTYDNYKRTNPQALQPPSTRPIMETTGNYNKKVDDRPTNILSRALNKLKSR